MNPPTSHTMETPAPTHEVIDRIIKRQQGRLLSKLRETCRLDPQTETAVCRSFGWTGQDIHAAIEGKSTEATNANRPR